MENSPSTRKNFLAKFHLFPERASLFHNNSTVTLHCSPATTILNENPVLTLLLTTFMSLCFTIEQNRTNQVDYL